MREANILGAIVLAILFIVLSVASSGCTTPRPVVVVTPEPIIRSQISVDRIERISGGIAEDLRSYDTRLGELYERIIRRSLDAEGALEEYDRFVFDLITNYRRVEREIDSLRREVEGEEYYSFMGRNPFLD